MGTERHSTNVESPGFRSTATIAAAKHIATTIAGSMLAETIHAAADCFIKPYS
jgi:hypothetical protein